MHMHLTRLHHTAVFIQDGARSQLPIGLNAGARPPAIFSTNGSFGAKETGA